MKRSLLLGFLLACLFGAATHGEMSREQLFAIPSVEELPVRLELISERESDGVVLSEFYLNGAPFAGAPTRIYAFYARPKKVGIWPGVVQLHGSGLKTLKPDSALGYAKAGYACISIDWAGPDYGGKGEVREPPCSEFRSLGNRARIDPETKQWQVIPPEQDARANGVRFIRRALQFLRTRAEVDPDRLCISGMSAGAQATLVVLGLEPRLKAAAVKYGAGFARELNWGGAYGPISAASRVEPEAAANWLAVMDPRHGLAEIRAKTLMLSGTDDIFYFLPAVLATWRAIPSTKTLLMLPNDSHSQVGNEEAPRQWFDHVLGRTAAAWPEVGAIEATPGTDGVTLSVRSTGDLVNVTYWWKCMPRAVFRYGRGTKNETTVKWQSTPARNEQGRWQATLPVLAADEQRVAYATVETTGGVKVSSDTVELPLIPSWGRDVR